MSLTTYFQFTHESCLPLPSVKSQNARQQDSPGPKPETSAQIQDRGIETAIRMLHKPEIMIMLNPLVQHYSRLPANDRSMHGRMVDVERLGSEFNVSLADVHSCSDFADSQNGEFVHYEIVDKFKFMGGMASKLLTYRACFRPLYENTSNIHGRNSIGLETISDPGNGVALLGRWSVSVDDRKPGSLILTENVRVFCNVLMGWYVRGQLETAHEQLHKEFGRMFCELMVKEDPMRGYSERAGKMWSESIDKPKQIQQQSTESETRSQPISGVGITASTSDSPDVHKSPMESVHPDERKFE